MRIARSNSLIGLVILFLTLLSFAPAYSAAAERKSTLSKKELKGLLKTAKTPSEHRTIAAYYRQEAQRLMDSSRQRWKRSMAKQDVEKAEKATKLAALHEEMARKAEAVGPAHDGLASTAAEREAAGSAPPNNSRR